MSEETNPIRILVVDDHPVVRAGIESLVVGHKDVSVVAQAANGREAIQQFRTHRPDVTLMDLQMPEMNGLDALIAIRDEAPEARIIMLTTYAGDAQVQRAIKAGARGYLLKSSLHEELLQNIRAVYVGRKAISAEASYELAEHATQERFVYYHRWRVGDVLMWDERATMHRGAGDSRPEERRIMLRTIVYRN